MYWSNLMLNIPGTELLWGCPSWSSLSPASPWGVFRRVRLAIVLLKGHAGGDLYVSAGLLPLSHRHDIDQPFISVIVNHPSEKKNPGSANIGRE